MKELRDYYDSETEDIRLLGIVILFEDEELMITTPKMLYLEKYSGAVFYSSELTKQFQEHISVFDLKSEINQFDESKRTLATLLQEGKCNIFNKRTMKYIEQIKVETFSTGTRGTLAGYGGRKFMIEDKVLFEITDMLH